MTQTIQIRAATPSDIDWIVEELKKFSEFHDSRIPLFPDESHAKMILQVRIDKHILLIAESGETPMGFISGIYSQHVFNPAIFVLTETLWWVAHEHRGTRAGLMLLNEFVAIGKSKANWLSFNLETKSPVSERALTRRGFHLTERSYLLEVC